MSRSFQLGLRNNRHTVSLVKLEGRPRAELGVAYPEETDRRARILERWGNAAGSPRAEQLATINIPLPVRTRTILSYQLDDQARELIDGSTTTLPDKRDVGGAGARIRVQLGRSTR